MANIAEKQRRKALAAQNRQIEQSRQDAALPLARTEIKALFDAVNSALEAQDCDHTLGHTLAFLSAHRLPTEPVLTWLRSEGGLCDCEVIANVEETWGGRVGSLTL